MHKRSILSIALVVVSLFAFAMPLGCVNGPTKTIITTSGTVTAVIQEAPITIPVTTYPVVMTGTVPGDLIITIGGGYADPVTNLGMNQSFQWINVDHEAHTVTSIGEYGGLFDFTLLPGESIDYSIKNPDTYEYYCKLHPGEDALLVVGDLGS